MFGNEAEGCIVVVGINGKSQDQCSTFDNSRVILSLKRILVVDWTSGYILKGWISGKIFLPLDYGLHL